MSRTDKDRPYWVKLNDDGNSTDHNHLVFGKEYYRNRPVKDEYGRYSYVEVDVVETARSIMEKSHYWGYSMDSTAYRTARNLCSAGYGHESVVLRTETRVVTERVLVMRFKDYCTAGEKIAGSRWGRHNGVEQLPCTPEVTGISWRALYDSNKPGIRKSARDEYFGARRNEARDLLGRAKNLYNNGDDLEDFNDLQLTRQTRSSVDWDLW